MCACVCMHVCVCVFGKIWAFSFVPIFMNRHSRICDHSLSLSLPLTLTLFLSFFVSLSLSFFLSPHPSIYPTLSVHTITKAASTLLYPVFYTFPSSLQSSALTHPCKIIARRVIKGILKYLDVLKEESGTQHIIRH